MVSGMDAMFSCIFNVYDVRMRVAIPCMVSKGYLRGPPLKRSRFTVEEARRILLDISDSASSGDYTYNNVKNRTTT